MGIAVCSSVNLCAAKPTATYVFADNLFDRARDGFPGKDLDVLFNVSGLGVGVAHDGPEKGIGSGLVLGDSLRSESFKVPPDPVLLLDRESLTDDRLEKVEHIDRCDPARVLVFSEHARDDNTVLFVGPLGLGHGGKGKEDRVVVLSSPDLDESSLGSPLFSHPALCHRVHIASDENVGLGSVKVVGMGTELRRSSERGLSAWSHTEKGGVEALLVGQCVNVLRERVVAPGNAT